MTLTHRPYFNTLRNVQVSFFMKNRSKGSYSHLYTSRAHYTTIASIRLQVVVVSIGQNLTCFVKREKDVASYWNPQTHLLYCLITVIVYCRKRTLSEYFCY